MQKTYKKSSIKKPLAVIITTAFVSVLLCGCSFNSNNMIDSKRTSESRFSNTLKTVESKTQKGTQTITKTKSGVYVYKDKAVINTTGRDFNYSKNDSVGPSDVKFDAENFKTKF